MIPRTIKVAAAVQSTLTSGQYLNYGNVILNGYLTTASGVSTAGAVGGIATVTISAAGTGYTNGTYTGVYLGGTTGTFGYATITVAGGAVTAATITSAGRGFTVGQVLTLGNIPRTSSGTNATLTVATVNTRSVRPVLKGWTTNYMNYYTELTPVAPYLNTYPGMDAGGFEYMVHSFKPTTGAVGLIGFTPFMGQGYTDGFYTNVATTTGAYGSGATLDIQVVGGQVVACTLNTPGTGYPLYTTLSVAGGAIGPGTGFFVVVMSLAAPISLNGQPLWSQRPVNAQSQVNSLFPLPGGGGGWIYPVADSPVPPPIDTL